MVVFIVIACWLLIGIPTKWLVDGLFALAERHPRPRYRRTAN